VLQKVEVTWPSGQKQSFGDVQADKFYLIQEGHEKLEPQPIEKANATIPTDKVSTRRK
jgi:hypothetical protein